ncbi:MAG TPA: ABC transporter permease [Candidatus Berkiella sp.]|nr:ABC transporter permease [Candidatus Berkiella sp.]
MIATYLSLIPSGFLYALILSMVAFGVMIPFRLLNFPDLTAEGAYPLGGAVACVLAVKGGHPLLAILVATLCGGLMGIGTAYLHLRLRLNTLLSGIILSAMVYSINLRLMGKPNVPLFEINNLFPSNMFLLFCINVLILGLCYYFLLTEKGLRLRAVGLNAHCAAKQGIITSKYLFLGLFVGNALSALAGGIMVQIQHYADISMGLGIVIHALAALMIGESLVGTQTLGKQMLAPFVGAIIYQQMQGIALSMGLAPTDLKFITGAIVLLAISYQRFGVRQVS